MEQLRKRTVSSDLNERILKIMGSKHARKILQITHQTPLSALEISKTCDIPLTKTYRWLKRLAICKLLQPSGKVNEKSRKVRLYKSKVNMLIIDPTQQFSPKVEIVGSGALIECPKCSSENCTLSYDKKSNKTISQCLECKIKYQETLSHMLKEEEQKFIILDSLSSTHTLREEQQKVFLLEKLLDTSIK